jgi:nucleotide-binding universal stress UspA family protein
MKILVAVDGSTFTKRMLAYLAAHDEWLGDRHQYTVLHTAAAVPPRAAAVLDRELLKSHYEEESDRVFKPIRTFFEKQKLRAEFVAKVGHAGEVIAKTATQGKFDLVMMGSHGHNTLANLVMGSVATKVMAHCDTPVLLIR